MFCHPHSGRPLDRTSVTNRFQRVCKRAGIRDDVVFHDLRHTLGTMMAAAGVPLRTLQGWMGHADVKTTSIYMHFAPAEDEVQTANRVFPQPRRPRRGPLVTGRDDFISEPPRLWATTAPFSLDHVFVLRFGPGLEPGTDTSPESIISADALLEGIASDWTLVGGMDLERGGEGDLAGTI